VFTADAVNLLQTTLRSSEQLRSGFNVCKFGSLDEAYFGYILLTTQRLFRVLFLVEKYESFSPTLAILGLLTIFLGPVWPTETKTRRPNVDVVDMSSREKKGGIIIDVPNSPLMPSEITSRTLIEYPLANVTGIEHSQYTVAGANQNRQYHELIVGFTPNNRLALVFYDDGDMRQVYSILAASLERDIDKLTHPVIDLADQLEKLSNLYRYQIITDEEYETAKNKLMGSKN
jgi:hypothetical protein